MTKAKTNALDALRTLIAERQQYEQWIATLEAKREGTPEHVYDRVRADYQSRLERVVGDIRGHAEELQLSISTLSSRLVEVAREEDTRREGLQEAELRAAVGEYEPDQWEQLRTEAERSLEKIAADRASLDSQLSELRAIQKLSEVGSPALPASASTDRPQSVSQPERPAAAASSVSQEQAPAPAPSSQQPASSPQQAPKTEPAKPAEAPATAPVAPTPQAQAGSGAAAAHEQGRQALEPVGARAAAQPGDAAASASGAPRARTGRTPPSGSSAMRPRSEAAKPDNAKTLKCPECGTANYPTEWYCERCGGELATM
jgi:hypothetical protein